MHIPFPMDKQFPSPPSPGEASAFLCRLVKAGVPIGSLVCSSSTPLQHLPFSLDAEPGWSMADELRDRLAFATEKLGEIVAAAKAAEQELQVGAKGSRGSGSSSLPLLPSRDEVISQAGLSLERPEPYSLRRPKQIQLPPFPTTSIGSFPQTQGE